MTPRQVTPEEEIADLQAFLDGIKQFPNDDTFRYETDRGGVMAILAAIRAAENDALERAATWHDQRAAVEETKAGKSPDQIAARGIRLERAEKHRSYAGAIRELKHKDVS